MPSLSGLSFPSSTGNDESSITVAAVASFKSIAGEYTVNGLILDPVGFKKFFEPLKAALLKDRGACTPLPPMINFTSPE